MHVVVPIVILLVAHEHEPADEPFRTSLGANDARAARLL
jgi:hypothetical protein